MMRKLPFVTAAIAMIVWQAAALGDEKQTCVDASGQGQTLRDAHRLLEAREQLRICAQASCPIVVQRDCAAWLEQLDLALPTVVFDARDPAGNDISAASVTIDGRPLTTTLDGTALPVDPGEHTFTFEVAGQPPVTRTLVLKEGDKARRVPVVIGTAAGAGPSGAPVSPAPHHPAGLRPQQTAGLVVGGVGMAALAAGGAFGLLATSAKSEYERHCGSAIGAPAGFCDALGVSGHSDASTKATLSTALFIGGGALAGLGATLFLLAPRDRTATQVGLAPEQVFIRGRF